MRPWVQSGVVNTPEKLFRALQALLGEDADLALFTGSAIMPCRGAGSGRQSKPFHATGEGEKRQHRFVDLVVVERHPRTIAHRLICRISAPSNARSASGASC